MLAMTDVNRNVDGMGKDRPSNGEDSRMYPSQVPAIAEFGELLERSRGRVADDNELAMLLMGSWIDSFVRIRLQRNIDQNGMQTLHFACSGTLARAW